MHTGKFQEVELEDTGNNWHVILFKQFVGESFASVDLGSERVSLGQRYVDEPDPPTGLVALEIRVVVVQESKYGSDDYWHTLLVRARASLQIYTKCLLCVIVSIS